ncbi:hypothetical protein [Pseudoxanthomonas mexicana]|uniref:hypothetical protein n=1 Tax=Pseudoxanthomonas mexicana TaxID=128785 RepID=UPI00398AC785
MNAPSHDDAFDRQARQLHANALARLTPQTLARLRAARQQAAAAPAPRRGQWRWLAATACSMVLAVLVVTRFSPSTTEPATEAPAIAAASEGEGDTVLDENPDFFLWLATADNPPLAME